MAKLSRKGDQTEKNGKIVKGANSVFANGKPVGIHVSDITPHGNKKHKKSKTTEGSPSVFVEGSPVLRTGSSTTCGHKVNQGSPNVNVP